MFHQGYYKILQIDHFDHFGKERKAKKHPNVNVKNIH